MFIGQVLRTLTVEPVVEPVPDQAPHRAVREATVVAPTEVPGHDHAGPANDPALREEPAR